jgi:hypothetical protein
MPRPLASLTVLALASAFACSSPSQPATPLQPEAPVAQERCASPDELRVYTVPSGAILRGRVEFDHLWIEPGATVCVASDLELVVGGVARIDGALVALDGLNGEQRNGASRADGSDGPNIVITGGVAIEIRGEVRGGRGADVDIGRGGRGSSITLDAPFVIVDGAVRAGDGGKGPESGGAGGDARQRSCMLDTPSGRGGGWLYSGAGGTSNAPGGDGGDSGESTHSYSDPRNLSASRSLFVAEWERVSKAIDERLRSATTGN